MFETMVAAAANSAGMTTPRRLPQGSSTGPAYGEEEAPPQLSSSRSLMSAVSVSDPNDRNLDRASLVAASDVVQALFGVEVGPCWGDFFCTHSRIRGRLYAVTSGVLFYSNLLGFERRLCLQFRDIVSIALYRTTSIRIDIADDGSETYIFKSFHNRVHVIQLLMGLKRLADKKKSGQLTKLGALRSQSEGHEAGSRMQREEEQLEEERQFQERLEVRSPRSRMHLSSSSSSFQLPYTPTPPNRRRAVSDSVVRLFGVQEDLQEFAGDDPFLTMHSNGSDMKEAWETASREISSLEETGIEVRDGPCCSAIMLSP